VKRPCTNHSELATYLAWPWAPLALPRPNPAKGRLIAGSRTEARRYRCAMSAGRTLCFVGTYTHANRGGYPPVANGKGIYVFELKDSGEIVPVKVDGSNANVIECESNPSFLTTAPTSRDSDILLFASHELADRGKVSSWSLRAHSAGVEVTLKGVEDAKGGVTCHVSYVSSHSRLLAANYFGGEHLVSFSVTASGALQEGAQTCSHGEAGSCVVKHRQGDPHPHGVFPTKEGSVYLCDLGVDKVFQFRFSNEGRLVPSSNSLSLQPGSGPRHLALTSNAEYAYVLNELSNTVSACQQTTANGLREIGIYSTLPSEFTGHSQCAEIEIHPNDRWVYASNRGHDSIAVFHICSQDGTLSIAAICKLRGKEPRNFRIAPNGRFILVANQYSDSIDIYRLDADIGILTEVVSTNHIGSPVAISFSPVPQQP